MLYGEAVKGINGQVSELLGIAERLEAIAVAVTVLAHSALVTRSGPPEQAKQLHLDTAPACDPATCRCWKAGRESCAKSGHEHHDPEH